MEKVSAQKLAELVAQHLGEGATPEDAAWVLDSAVEVIKGQLAAGNEVVLGENVVAAMMVGDAPAPAPAPAAPAAADDIPSDMAVTEVIKVDDVAAGAAPAPVEALPVDAEAAAVAVDEQIDKSIETALEAAGPYSILFMVPSQDFFTNIIVGQLSGPKSAVSVVENVEQAKASIAESKPDLVILDSNVEGYSDLVSHIKTTQELSLIATIVIFNEGTDPGNVEGLRIFEDANIAEPFEPGDLVRLSEAELARSIEEREWFKHEINFQFQTAEQWVEGANDQLALLIDQSGLDDEASAAACVAFREAVDNAARHGNRLQAKRLIDVIYLVDKEKVSVTVEDEGDGFDAEAYLSRGREGNAVAAARARHEAGRVGGLGIMLMLRCVDDLEYNSIGNKLKLTKYLAA